MLGKKITLYPGATGDVGFGVSGNRLQIYADNPNADVAIGYDAVGTFNEKFAVKPTGALALSGNVGAPGQMMVSSGAGAPAVWIDKPRVIAFERSGTGLYLQGSDLCASIPGIDGQTFTLNSTSDITYLLVLNLFGMSWPAASKGDIEVVIEEVNSGNVVSQSSISYYVGSDGQGFTLAGVNQLAPGTYRINARLSRYLSSWGDVGVNSGISGNSSCGSVRVNPGQFIMQVFPK